MLFLNSCSEETEIKGDFDEKIVVNCLLHPDSIVKLKLTRSIVLNSTDIPVVENGAVILYENGSSLGQLSYSSNGVYVLDYNPQPGATYKLKYR